MAKPKSVVTKVDNKKKKDDKQQQREDIFSPKRPRLDRAVKSPRNQEAMETPKPEQTRIRRKLSEAVALDKSLNDKQEIGEASKLMYAVLPGNSQLIDGNFLRQVSNAIDQKVESKNSKMKSQQDCEQSKLENPRQPSKGGTNGKISNQRKISKNLAKQLKQTQQLELNNIDDEIEVVECNVGNPLNENQNRVNDLFVETSTAVTNPVEEREIEEILSPQFKMSVDPGEDDLDVSEDEFSEGAPTRQSSDAEEEGIEQFDNAKYPYIRFFRIPAAAGGEGFYAENVQTDGTEGATAYNNTEGSEGH